MNSRDATRLIAPAVVRGDRWADLGAGSGTFTEALARLLGPDGAVYAVERDGLALPALEQLAERMRRDEHAPITVTRGDFTSPLALPPLAGVLLANSLHYVPDDDQSALLERLGRDLDPGGVLLVVEYDNRPRSRWVPYPVSLTRLGRLTRESSLPAPELIGRRGSLFGGTMYAARITAP